MPTENVKAVTERVVHISDDDHLQVNVHLGRIKSIADVVSELDRQMDMSKHLGLLPATIESLMETIDSEVVAAKSVLNR